MYGKYKGTLMISMGCDGNNKLFPLTFAITKSENTNSWSWFLACIRVGVTQRKDLFLIFDHHPSIIAATNDTYSRWVEPNAYHRFSMRHLAVTSTQDSKIRLQRISCVGLQWRAKLKNFVLAWIQLDG